MVQMYVFGEHVFRDRIYPPVFKKGVPGFVQMCLQSENVFLEGPVKWLRKA